MKLPSQTHQLSIDNKNFSIVNSSTSSNYLRVVALTLSKIQINNGPIFILPDYVVKKTLHKVI